MDAQQIESWEVAYDGAQAVHRKPDGIELYYEHRGEGPWVTIVSSVFVIATAWRNFTQRLVDSNTVLAYDLRNLGASSTGDGAFPNHVDDLGSLLDGLGIEQTYLLGASISTLICRDYAIANPERVKGMILCGPTLSPYGSKRRTFLLKSWLSILETGGPTAVFDNFFPLVFGDQTIGKGGTAAYLALRERFLDLNSAAQLRANLEGWLVADDDPSKLAELSCPVMLLTGDDDYTNSPSVLQDAADMMPDGSVKLLERCGHVPYFEAPEEFETAVQEFIAEVESRQPSTPARSAK
jgi:3-oxoadipate enol-lactonase